MCRISRLFGWTSHLRNRLFSDFSIFQTEVLNLCKTPKIDENRLVGVEGWTAIGIIYTPLWNYVELFWNYWNYLEIFGITWKFLELLGNFWNYLKIFGIIWKYLELLGNIWNYLENIWNYLELFGITWKLLELYYPFFFLFIGIEKITIFPN